MVQMKSTEYLTVICVKNENSDDLWDVRFSYLEGPKRNDQKTFPSRGNQPRLVPFSCILKPINSVINKTNTHV